MIEAWDPSQCLLSVAEVILFYSLASQHGIYHRYQGAKYESSSLAEGFAHADVRRVLDRVEMGCH